MLQAFESDSVRMDPMVLMTVQMPVEDVERIMTAVSQVTPLTMGNYDSNAYQSASGTERYRPLMGAAAGAEPDVRLRTGVVAVSFELPDDRRVLEMVVEAVFQAHSY